MRGPIASAKERDIGYYFGLAFCTVSSLAIVFHTASGRVALCAGAGLLQGALAMFIRRRQSGPDSVGRALMRVALLSPVLALPVLYLVFRERLGWPWLVFFSAWCVGGLLAGGRTTLDAPRGTN
jgi:hypothetical protein